MDDNYDMIIKIVIVGDSGVGKSGILTRYLKNEYSEDSKATVGVEFGAKKLNINGKNIKAQIWDTAGQERYRSVTNAYYKGAKGAMIVYDTTQKSSFENVERWIKEVKVMGNPDLCLILVGNKNDLTELRSVLTSDGEDKAECNGIAFIETSAKTADNIDKAFTIMTENIVEKFKKDLVQNVDELYLDHTLEIDHNTPNNDKKDKCKC